MAHVILTGATGLAGSAILSYCLASPSIGHVSVLSRRPVKAAEGNPKATVIIHEDFSSFPSPVLDKLRGATGCIWAQGKSQIGMTESDYTRLTHDWPLAAATAFADLPSDGKMKFVYISGEGADPTEKTRTMFGRIKGRCEKDLIALADTKPSLSAYNLRPAAIDPMGKREVDRPWSWTTDFPVAVIGPVLKTLMPSMHTPTNKLAEIAVQLATGDGASIPEADGVEADGWTLRNTAIRRMTGLSKS
ncbi:hypothetical protein MBLNU459_g4832t1 [Dothideomycetes sp. NU459]